MFVNRLRTGMLLQTDPTVMYAAFLATGRWSRDIHRSDLERSHPYNTYAVKGLPPGPIASAVMPARIIAGVFAKFLLNAVLCKRSVDRVANGKQPQVRACALCHYPNGKGRPENAGVTGLPEPEFQG